MKIVDISTRERESKNFCLCCNGHDILAPYFDFEGFNPVKNIWNKIDKSGKTGQEKKILITTLNCFLTAIAKVYFLKGRLGNMSPPKFEIFYISLFPKILRLNSLGKS